MDPILLRDQLAKLHEELRSAPPVDAEASLLLGELSKDIQRLMSGSTTASALPAAQTIEAPASLPGRLEKLAVLFEVDHPTLAASSRRLIDLLGKVGL